MTGDRIRILPTPPVLWRLGSGFAGQPVGDLRQRLAVVPRQPLARIFGQRFGVALQRAEVIEGIGPGELRGVDQTHEDIPDPGAVLGLIE